jgi:hypothetical protein
MNDPERQAKIEKLLLAICPFALIFSLITSLAGDGERESAAMSLLSIGLPMVVTISVILLGIRVLGRTPAGTPGRGSAIFFMALGIAVGVTVLIVRFNPGPHDLSQTVSPAVTLSAEATELKAALVDWSVLHEKLKKARWQATAMRGGDFRELGLEDLRETLTAQREFRDACQRYLQLLTKLKDRGTLPSVRRELLSQGTPPNSLNPEITRMITRLIAAGYEANLLVEANWEEYRMHGLSTSKEDAVAPWQKEALALREEMISLQAAAAEISETPATPSAK